jgi:hypothetical protein
VREVDPIKGTILVARQDFTATWLVKNIGRNDWYRVNMDYVYTGGDKLHKVESYSIPKGVDSGKQVYLPVEMETPKNQRLIHNSLVIGCRQPLLLPNEC